MSQFHQSYGRTTGGGREGRRSGRRWSQSDLSMLQLLAKRGSSARQIAWVLGRSERSVWNKACTLNISLDGGAL